MNLSKFYARRCKVKKHVDGIQYKGVVRYKVNAYKGIDFLTGKVIYEKVLKERAFYGGSKRVVKSRVECFLLTVDNLTI
jgi:hypothetical protein